MSQVQKQQQEFISPFLVFAAVVCTVVGVGIFYKNGSVFAGTGNNGIGVLVAGLFVGFICMCTSFSYSRISLVHNTDLGYCGWAESVVNRKFSCFVSQIFVVFKLGICIPAYCFYAASTFLKIIWLDLTEEKLGGSITPAIGMVFLIGVGLLICFMTLNYYSPMKSIALQKMFLYAKFIPIGMAVVFGIALSIKLGDGGLFASKKLGDSGTTNITAQPFSMLSVLTVAPGIMMSFDAFLNAGFFAKKLKEPKRFLPRIYMFLLLFLVVLYLVITINQVLCGTGSAADIFHKSLLGEVGSMVAKRIFLFLVFISALGLVNGYSTIMISSIKQSFNDNFFCFKQRLIKACKGDEKKAAGTLWIILATFWSTLMITIGFATKSGAILDGITNVPAIFMFAVYGSLSGVYGYKRLIESGKKWKSGEKVESDEFLVCLASFIACVGGLGVALFQVIYIGEYILFKDPTAKFKAGSGPGKTSEGTEMLRGQASVVMLLCIGVVLGFYLVNGFFQKRANKKALLTENNEETGAAVMVS